MPERPARIEERCKAGQSPSEFAPTVKRLCRQLVQSWRNLKDQQIEVSALTGGISNSLYKVTAHDQVDREHDMVVVRVYADYPVPTHVDREREQQVLISLNSIGFGAEVLGIFGNGRIEAFLKMRELQPEDMGQPDMAAKIAKRLRQLHQHVPTNVPKHVPLFDDLQLLLKLAGSVKLNDPQQQRRKDDIYDGQQMAWEVREMKSIVESMDCPVVLSHLDLLANNIFVPADSKGTDFAVVDMQFIDFEYAAWCYQWYDLGNHFDEYAGFEGEYDRFPDQEQAKHFVRSYLQQGQHTPSEEEVEAGVAASLVFSLVAHLYWGIWFIFQSMYPPSEGFDYLGNAQMRLNEYHNRKSEFLNQYRRLARQQTAA
ncbi:hypothetical protein WJX74_007122 [Apatococcus lobatus]|uniref:ethanolamine kinase n=2 Tax=Apatococcus TaxID=904362 RepID=A0AAW1TA97_9CHLO